MTVIQAHDLCRPRDTLSRNAQVETGLDAPASTGASPTLLLRRLPIMLILRKTRDLAKIRIGCLAA